MPIPAPAYAEDDLTEEYVALGDSFAAGPLILPRVELSARRRLDLNRG